ncbi:osmoprotectant transport system ATP-binding protein [Antricoccus suffuscus]|uniref:ABC-type quaternary amine transporter n=1 Tax=Antricoccus suffuscus TaxID=1629062 RepID=A0A2T0ZXY6_9ACTN|nr:ATP-binding cassette domain-containing protein [Antricoccus suffuscus]PRZ41216.1 osmoprotectant transport system ATP-binding protein [Antricoccus suffuscus]
MITFESVTKEYPDGTSAVSGLDLEIPPGKITVLVGPSGCGKTTSLRMINRMIDPTSGRVLIDGADVAGTNPAKLRRGIGYVIQNAGLFPHRTIVDNIATVPMLNGESKAKSRRTALDLLEVVGLDPAMARRYPTQLSGGQQQRVGVARALAADPPILLMDEPFSAVDPVVRHNLQEELLRLQSQLDKTIVFVTHDIDEAITIGELICVLNVGGVLEQAASPKELLENPANEFVSSFVGKDRGFRGLSFVAANGLTLAKPPVILRGDALEKSTSAWTLMVDDKRRPLGWLPPEATTTDESQPLAEGVFSPDDSVRRALDIAILAPSGSAISVDDEGVLLGTVAAGDIVESVRSNGSSATVGVTV